MLAFAHRSPRRSSFRRAPARLRDPSARGQGIVEYGLILGLSALLALVLLVFFGGALSAFLQVVGDAIDAAS
jgi:Flp pilus assembly pilin Flp